MFSTLTERGAGATIEALSLGASDYVTKPSNTMSQDEARQRIRSELIPKIKALCRQQTPISARPAPAARPGVSQLLEMPKARIARPIQRERRPIEIVAIGTSTGGPNALAAVLPAIAKDFPVPIVIVQHMPPIFTRMLAERLDSRSAIGVREATEGAALEPGIAWIAPGDFHLTVERRAVGLRLHLNQEPQEKFLPPRG